MIETIFTGLILALFSGITIFSFKHKKAFDKIFSQLIKILGIIFIPIIIWSYAIEISFIIIDEFIKTDKLVIAKKSLPIFSIESEYIILIYFLILIYLNSLKYLTTLVDNEK